MSLKYSIISHNQTRQIPAIFNLPNQIIFSIMSLSMLCINILHKSDREEVNNDSISSGF